VAVQFKTWTVFARFNAGVIVSNPTRGMDVCMCLFCFYCPVCMCKLCDGPIPHEGVLPTVYSIKKLKKRPRRKKGCRAINNNNFLHSKVVSFASNLWPRWSDLCIYVSRPRDTVTQLYTRRTGFHFRRHLRLAGQQWRYSNSPLYGTLFICNHFNIILPSVFRSSKWPRLNGLSEKTSYLCLMLLMLANYPPMIFSLI
jgi:hypothetical protein